MKFELIKHVKEQEVGEQGIKQKKIKGSCKHVTLLGRAHTWLFKIQKIFPSLFYLFINLYIYIYLLPTATASDLE